ncbi:MAG TPA: fibronectin type III domain-containing protein, partial [Bacteroidales bacterium]|nr:fibronectin type III domain-containing protein [Bacteroidales bacterium]
MKKLLLMWIALLAFGVSFGQSITNYAFSYSFTGSLEDMSSGTTNLMTGNNDDEASALTDIGFTFYFMGTPYTQFSVNSNGQLRLGSPIISSYSITSFSAGVPILAPMAGDNEVNNGIVYKVIGTAPNRILVVQWNEFAASYYTDASDGDMQVLLYEGSGKIDFIYGEIYNSSSSAVTRSIFISSSNTASTAGYVTVGATPTFTPAASPTTNSFAASVLIANLGSTTQGNRTVYTWTPPTTVTAPTNLTFTNVGASKMTLNWTDSPDETFYIISNSLDGITYTPVTNLPANAVSYQANGLTPSTLYYWKVNATVESGLLSTDLTGSQSTLAQVPLHGIYSINNLFPTTAVLLHDGTDNFNNFTDAINYLNDNGISASVTFAVAAGQTFAEDCPAITASGTSVNKITFIKAGAGANPIISPTGTTATGEAGIAIVGGDYITFNAIDIAIASGSNVEYGYYIANASATDGAQYNAIANCKVTLNRANTAARGISQYTPISATNASGANSYNIYHKNIIENCYHGIQLTGTSSTYPDINCVIDSNIVGAATANDIGGGSSAANGIRANYQQNITIFGNIVRNVTASSSVYGIYAQYLLGTDNNIGNNIVYSINMTGTGTTTYVYGLRTDINSGAMANIFNNMVSDLNHGITTASSNVVVRGIGVGLTGTGTSNIVHNSVLISEDAAASSAALYLGSSGTHNVLNNVFANTSATDATSKRYCIYRTTGATLYSDYNDLFVDAAGTNNYAGYFTADRNTLADWQTASSQDAHSISVDPTFNGLTDLHTTNPALNGTAMLIPEITEDIDGEARDTYFPDMGADENLTPVVFTCTTPTPGNTIASSTALCYGDGVLLTLENATAGTGVTYQWQSSTDGITYTNITGATAESYGTIQTAATYFQCVVTCHEGPVS